MTVAIIAAAAAVGFVLGLRWKHRRFLTERSKRVALETRMDAYRLADARTDLDVIGPVTGEQPAVEQFDQDAEDRADLALVAPRMATDSGRRTPLEEVMAEHGITQDELDAVPQDALEDDTGPGTVAHLRESGPDGVYGRWIS